MITITDGIMTLRVTQGAFKDIFQPQGFIAVTNTDNSETFKPSVDLPNKFHEPESESATVVAVDPSADEYDTNEESIETNSEPETDLSEIPLSQMTNRQLREYAEQLGVDLTGITSRKAVINKIKAAL